LKIACEAYFRTHKPGGWKESDFDGQYQNQDQGEDKGRQRDEDEGCRRQKLIGRGADSVSTDNAEGDRNRYRDDLANGDQFEGDG
jgi:hypothetical protein